MTIFNSYVKLPEGTVTIPGGKPIRTPHGATAAAGAPLDLLEISEVVPR